MRQMPSSIDAEQSLLGSLFIYPNSVRIASEEGLRSEEFFLEAHRKIYAAVETLNGEGKPVDAGRFDYCEAGLVWHIHYAEAFV